MKSFLLFPIILLFLVVSFGVWTYRNSNQYANQLWIERCVVPATTGTRMPLDQRNEIAAQCVAYYTWLQEQRKVWRTIN